MRNSIRLASLVIGSFCGVAAGAQNWEFDPRLELGVQYSDNYRLDFAGNETDVSGPYMDATLPVRLIDQLRKLEIAPRVHATYFPDEREEDSSDYFVDALFEQRTQRRILGVQAHWSREDVVRSELPTSDSGGDLGDPTIGDAGRVVLRNRRDLIRVAPYWSYDVSQRHRIEAGATYLDASFANDREDVQRDYTDYGVYAGWGWLLSQRTSVTLRARASQYETSFDSDGYGAEVEWRSSITQTSQVYLRLGGQRTDIDLPNSSAKTSVIVGAGGRWTWPTANLFADLTRSVGPTASGAVVERSQLRFRLTRALQPRLSLVAGVRATRDESIDDDAYPRRDYLTGEVGFDWRMTRKWTLLVGYHYIWQEYSDEPSDRSSNAVSLGIVYEPGRGD
jgi:hypothetical protein